MARLEATVTSGYSISGHAFPLVTDNLGNLQVAGTVTTSGTHTITGSVTVTNQYETQAVSGTVQVSGTHTITGSVTVTNQYATQAVSGTVQVSGTHTITGSVTINNAVTAYNGLNVPIHDYIGLTYDGSSNLTGVNYQKNSVSVATLTLGYTSANALSSVTRT